MIIALIEKHGWVEINEEVYSLIKNPVRGKSIWLLPKVIAVFWRSYKQRVNFKMN